MTINNIEIVTIEFGFSATSSYKEALTYIPGWLDYSFKGEGKDIVHQVCFGKNELKKLVRLASKIGRIKKKKVWVNNIEANWKEVFSYADCYANYGPKSHCYEGNRGFELIACQEMCMGFNEFTPWLKFGRKISDDVYEFDKSRIVSYLNESVKYLQLCPHSNFSTIEPVMDAFPAKVNIAEDKRWHWRNDLSVLNQLEMVTKDFNDEYFIRNYLPENLKIEDFDGITGTVICPGTPGDTLSLLREIYCKAGLSYLDDNSIADSLNDELDLDEEENLLCNLHDDEVSSLSNECDANEEDDWLSEENVEHTNIENIRVEFSFSSSASYKEVLDQFSSWPSYHSTGTGKNVVNQLRFGINELKELARLVILLKNIRKKSVWINGNEADWKETFSFLRCYSKKGVDDQKYCCVQGFGPELIPCKERYLGFEQTTPWLTYGKYNDNTDEFEFDKNRIVKVLKAFYNPIQLCPCFNFNSIEPIINALPEKVSFVKDDRWMPIRKTNYSKANFEANSMPEPTIGYCPPCHEDALSIINEVYDKAGLIYPEVKEEDF